MNLRVRRPVPLHPLLFATVPVLVLYANNITQGVTVGDVLGPLALIVGVTAGVFLVLSTAFGGNAWKASVVTSLLVVLFFAYGPVLHGVGHGSLVLAVCAALAIAGAAWMWRAEDRRAAGLTRALNVVAAGLVVVNVANLTLTKLHTHAPAVLSDVLALHGAQSGGSVGRDIYLLVLDDYGGARALHDLLGYDNQPFLDQLRRRGFSVPSHATTNYPHTADALGAELNLDYVQRFVRPEASRDWSAVYTLLKQDAVPRFLRQRGYTYVHIGSWWTPTASNPQADVNIRMKGSHSEFTDALIDQTTGAGPGDEARSRGFQTREYARVLFQFDQLEKTARVPGPKFVFGHVLIPHEPFIFDPTGRFVDGDERARYTQAQNYIRQLRFANAKALALIDLLLDRPAPKRPIIVLQSDEGFYTGLNDGANATDEELQQHFGILNAYFFPGVARTGLPPTVTPVNTFRLLFDDYFGTKLPLLPDRNYVFRDREHLYDFIDVTSRVRAVS